MYAPSRLAQHSASVMPGRAAAARAATASSLIAAPVRIRASSSADFTSRSAVYSRSRNTIRPTAASRSLARAGTGPITPSRASRGGRCGPPVRPGGEGIEGGVEGRRVTGPDVGVRGEPTGVGNVVVEADKQQVAPTGA